MPVQEIFQGAQQGRQCVHTVGEEQPPDPQHLKLWIVGDQILGEGVEPVQNR